MNIKAFGIPNTKTTYYITLPHNRIMNTYCLVRIFDDKIITLHIKSNDSIQSIKQQIQDKIDEDITPAQQQLYSIIRIIKLYFPTVSIVRQDNFIDLNFGTADLKKMESMNDEILMRYEREYAQEYKREHELCINGRALDNDKTLGDYDIKMGTVLVWD